MAVSTATSPQPPGRSVRQPSGPSLGLAECRPGEIQACDLAFSLLPAGDAIPTKKLSPSPTSLGHQYRKFSFEGTTDPAVTPLGCFSFESAVGWAMLTCLPEAGPLCMSEEEQRARAAGFVPHEFREGLIMFYWLACLGHLFARTLKPGVKLKTL